jgi:FkbM family methyltransferase
MNVLIRFLAWVERFIIAFNKLGLINTCKIFILGRLTNRNLKLFLPNNLLFIFRGNKDLGVVSHFYKEGYKIENTQEKPIRTILDCGANIGDETARFLLHHPSAEICAIEAEKSNFELLKSNFETVYNVKTIQAAIYSLEKRLKIFKRTSSMESFSVVEFEDNSEMKFEESVEALTILTVMNQMGWKEIDILKLDIEGAEYDLFTKNYVNWIDKVNCFIFEVPDNDKPGSTQAIFSALTGISFNTYICGENLVLIKSSLPWSLKKVVGFEI